MVLETIIVTVQCKNYFEKENREPLEAMWGGRVPNTTENWRIVALLQAVGVVYVAE